MPRLNDLLDAKLARDLFQRTFPEDRKKADKLEKLATDDNVEAIIEALPQVPVDSHEFDAAAWSAVGVLVHAAARPDAQPPSALLLEELARKLSVTDHGNRVLLWELLGFFPEVPAAMSAREVLDAEFQKAVPGPTAGGRASWASIEEQNGITFDRAATKVTGSKGVQRAAKPIREWLKNAALDQAARVTVGQQEKAPSKKAPSKKAPSKKAPAKTKAASQPPGATTMERIGDRKLVSRLKAKDDVPLTRKELEKFGQFAADPASVADLVAALDGDRSEDFRDDGIAWVLGVLCLAVEQRTEGWAEACGRMQQVVAEQAAHGPGEQQYRLWQPFSLFTDEPAIVEVATPIAQLVADTPSAGQAWADEIGLVTPPGCWEVAVSFVGQGLLFLAAVDRRPADDDRLAFWVSRSGGSSITTCHP